MYKRQPILRKVKPHVTAVNTTQKQEERTKLGGQNQSQVSELSVENFESED